MKKLRNKRATRRVTGSDCVFAPFTERQHVVRQLTVCRENDALAKAAHGPLSARTVPPMIGIMAVLIERSLTVPLMPAGGHTARCRIAVSDSRGWEVRLEIDERVVALTHCADWHHVERLCSTMSRIWASHTEPSARR